MQNGNGLTSVTESVLKDFFTRFDVRSIEINKNLNFNSDREVSDVQVNSRHEVEGQSRDYCISFKLQDQGADLHRYIRSIEADALVGFTDQGDELQPEEKNRLVQHFIGLIKGRVEKAKQEQDVQSIRFVGNTFILNKSTTFKVLSDDGDGRLNIEIISGEGLQEALLSAHGLLDGLYTGFIELVES